MIQSKLFHKTMRNKTVGAESASHDLLTRAGFIDQTMAGVYSFLPLGFRVLKKIEDIIRKNMEMLGGQEILMPVLHPKENWLKTGRWDSMDVLFKISGSGDKEYVLGPTHEEIISPLAKKVIFSYRDLPFSLFQVQTKFRDELRAKSGILRTREFLMKDLYSFHANQADLDDYYEKAAKIYTKIFKEFGLGKHTYRTFASGGSFSKYSDEFQTITEVGEDIIYICRKCSLAINKEIINENKNCPKCEGVGFDEKKSIEVGNIFKMGTKYSLPFDLKFTDKDGHDKPVIMGCYGIGLGRALGAIVEINKDEKGIIWPKSVSPFNVHLLRIENNPKVVKFAEKISTDLRDQGIEALYDDRHDKGAGEKFADSDLIGIPLRVIVSEKTLAKNSVEVKERNKKEAKLVKIKQLSKFLISLDSRSHKG